MLILDAYQTLLLIYLHTYNQDWHDMLLSLLGPTDSVVANKVKIKT